MACAITGARRSPWPVYKRGDNAGDLDQAKTLVTDSQRFLFLEAITLLGIFPGLDPSDTNVVDAASGLAKATAAVSERPRGTGGARQTIRASANLLGFESDSLMLVQKFAGQSGDIFDSFDAFQLYLDPTSLSSPLGYTRSPAHPGAHLVRYLPQLQDQLTMQLPTSPVRTTTASTKSWAPIMAHLHATPTNNVGSEIWQQLNSIQAVRVADSEEP